MTNERFQEILKEVLADIEGTLGVRAGHYSFGDRLSNFKRAGEAQRCTPAKALIGMMQKHDVALLDYSDLLEEGKFMNLARWREVIVDGINYRILLLAMMQEIHDKVQEAEKTADDAPEEGDKQ